MERLKSCAIPKRQKEEEADLVRRDATGLADELTAAELPRHGGRVTTKRRRTPRATPSPPPLAFRGLDLCDRCGAELEEGHRLSGLCPACLPRAGGGSLSGPGPRRERGT